MFLRVKDPCCAQAERQKQQDEEWERSERKRQETFEAKGKAAQNLEEQRKQHSEQLATLRARLDTLKAQKQDMVEQLKQVPALISPCTAAWNMPSLICGVGIALSLVLCYRS